MEGPGLFESLDYALRSVEYLAVYRLVTFPEAPLALHGALVARGERGVVLIGSKESGKSTLSTYLWGNGYRLLSDDGALFAPGSTVAYPVPRRVSLRRECEPLLGEDLWRRLTRADSFETTLAGCVFHPWLAREDARPGPVEVRALVLLDAAAEGAEMTRVDPVDGLFSIFAHTNLSQRDDRAPGMAATAALADRIPIFRLARSSLERMYGCLEQMLSHL